MRKSRTSISKAKSYAEIAEFWDTHDLADYWDQLKEVHFDVDVKSTVTLCQVDRDLWKQISGEAQRRGVPTNTLVNLWLKEKVSGAANEPLAKSA